MSRPTLVNLGTGCMLAGLLVVGLLPSAWRARPWFGVPLWTGAGLWLVGALAFAVAVLRWSGGARGG